MSGDKNKIRKSRRETPKELTADTLSVINRIDEQTNIIGVMYLLKGKVRMHTLPRREEVIFYKRLPELNKSIHFAIKELDTENEMIAYRIVTKNYEIIVTGDQEICACVMQIKNNRYLMN
ncbi:unnamed protein product [Chrysodeixis includens]|uniref:Uncharacterized protein n=1 Tax=Chrysodeixis includens TaxID=689277 RepID=A0A9N8L033_CHRIL|nr:unnamed protein product [Chrysodeixis includens]